MKNSEQKSENNSQKQESYQGLFDNFFKKRPEKEHETKCPYIIEVNDDGSLSIQYGP